MFFDTHAHLDDKQFNQDLEQVIEQAGTENVSLILNVGINLASSIRSIALAEKFPQIFASVGVHPHDAKAMDQEEAWHQLEELIRNPKVVALGEMGLDYYYNFSEPAKQQEVFHRQLELAKQTKLPVIIHNRDAHKDVLDILTQYRGEITGVLHCFSGSWEMAKQCLKLGYYISLGGPVTFKNAVTPKEVAKKLPIDRILIETDCPYLTPHPYRGKRNQPGYVGLIAQEIATIRGIELTELAEQTTANGKRLFNIT